MTKASRAVHLRQVVFFFLWCTFSMRMKLVHITSVFLLLAMLVNINLHLPVLQISAWAGMMVEYSRDNSFMDAAEMTFDGDHPCSMCKAIEKEQTKPGDDSISATSLSRLLLYQESPVDWIHTFCPLEDLRHMKITSSNVSTQPEVPPPRSAT